VKFANSISIATYSNLMKSIFTFLLLLVILASCKKEDTGDLILNDGCRSSVTKSVSANSSATSDGIIPLAIGNYWVYADSVWQDGKLTQAGIDTLSVTGVSNYNDEIWWIFSDGSGLSQKDDTVFELDRNIRCYGKNTLFFPVSYNNFQDSVFYFISMNNNFSHIQTVRNSRILEETVIVPAGSFRECSLYDILNYKKQIVKPGIGILYMNEEMSSSSYRHQRVLIDYSKR
jgi:hypothetical protein